MFLRLALFLVAAITLTHAIAVPEAEAFDASTSRAVQIFNTTSIGGADRTNAPADGVWEIHCGCGFGMNPGETDRAVDRVKGIVSQFPPNSQISRPCHIIPSSLES